tara:strand:+ start:1072 stop:1575 length:504 start_codon:yes stop_codon:yes gene_type:complete
MKKFLKLIYQFFLTIYIFESGNKFDRINKKGTSIFFIKSLNKIKFNKNLKKYFDKSECKLDRFKKKSKFIGLKRKDEIICSGWIYFGNKWTIEEINKKITLNNKYLLYDFITEKKFRNMGYYKLLLKIIQNKFKRKKLMIYSLSHNHNSIRAIENSGFKLLKKLKKF